MVQRAARYVAILLLAGTADAAPAPREAIASISVRPAFFNPTLGQMETVVVRLRMPASVTLSILDRDNYIIRAFPTVGLPAGESNLTWDGKDEDGTVVPNEAYSLYVTAESRAGRETYAPARDFQGKQDSLRTMYSAASGFLRYDLSAPARVHLQVGEAVPSEANEAGGTDGPVLRTIVDREPRVAGAVVDYWDGYDESGSIYIANLRHLAFSVFCEDLPENPLITVGNKSENFRAYASARSGRRRAFPSTHAGAGAGRHHMGLSALDDFSPPITLSVPGTKEKSGRVRVPDTDFEVLVAMNPRQAERFARADSQVSLFVDERRIAYVSASGTPVHVRIPPGSISGGEHRLVANWVSGHGPMSAQSALIVKGLAGKEGVQ